MRGSARKIVLLGLLFWSLKVLSVRALTLTATTFPLAEIAKKIAGEKEVHLLIPVGLDPHHFEPGYRDFERLFKSDLILAVGFEPWIRKNPLLARKTLFLSEESQLEDPHLWLDLRKLALFTRKLAETLARLEPSRASLYTRRATAVLAEIESLREDLKELSNCRYRKVVILGHAALGAFLREADLFQVALAGPHPESEVSPGRLRKILNLIREEKLPAVFLLDPGFQKYVPLFRRETGARVLTLNPGLPLLKEDRGLSFFELLRRNIAHLREGLCR